MNIAIIGLGAVGRFIAGSLKRGGLDVHVIARPHQIKSQEVGITVRTRSDNFTVNLPIYSELEQTYSLVIFAVKAFDLKQAYYANAEYLENGDVMTVQNGIQADNMLSSHFDLDYVYSSILTSAVDLDEDGAAVVHDEGRWIIGRAFRSNQSRCNEIADALASTFNVMTADDVVNMKWLRLFEVMGETIPAILGVTSSQAYQDYDLCVIQALALQEAIDIVKKVKISLTSLPHFSVDDVEQMAQLSTEDLAKRIAQESQQKIWDGVVLQSLKRSRMTEIDFLNGEIEFLAKQAHLTAPINQQLVALVHQVEQSKSYIQIEQLKQLMLKGGEIHG